MTRLEKARTFERTAGLTAGAAEASAAGSPSGSIDAWRPTYHVTPPVGWMNDPNGFCFHGSAAHLFFQYNPYAAKWGPMHWGHCVSEDFITWDRLPAALAPDRWYDLLMGCFSGTALSMEAAHGASELVLMYTGVSIFGRQQQCQARSENGIDFVKDRSNPVIPIRKLPSHAWKGAFRDPKLFVRDGAYHCLVGTQDRRTKTGMLLLYRSTDLRSWIYVNEAYACPSTDMIECPDLVELDGRDLLLFSPTNHPPREDGFRNMHAAVYSIGSLDVGEGVFSGDEYREIDGGFDFYAPQTLHHSDGRTIMIAWMQMWKRSMPTAERGLGWAGAMTLPRQLSLKNGALLQTPVAEIERYRAKSVVHRGVELDGKRKLEGIGGNRIELLVEVELGAASAFSLHLFVGSAHRTTLRFDRNEGRISFDRSASGVPIQELHAGGSPSVIRTRRYSPENGRLRLRVFLDRSSVELFLGDGELTMTGVVYPDPGDEGIEFASEGKAQLISVEKYDLEVTPPVFAAAAREKVNAR
jgi:beta-fructofuranosidase